MKAIEKYKNYNYNVCVNRDINSCLPRGRIGLGLPASSIEQLLIPSGGELYLSTITLSPCTKNGSGSCKVPPVGEYQLTPPRSGERPGT